MFISQGQDESPRENHMIQLIPVADIFYDSEACTVLDEQRKESSRGALA